MVSYWILCQNQLRKNKSTFSISEKLPGAATPPINLFIFAIQFDTMITTGSSIISIYTEMTPNPETMKFVANKLLYPGKSLDVADETLAAASPLAKELFSFPFIKAVFIASNFVTLTKTPDTDDWQDVIPTIKTFLQEYLENGGVVVNEEEVAKMKHEATNTVNADDDDIVKRVKELLENPEREIRGLLDYLGLPFEDNCLNFHQNTRAVRTASSEQVRRPINRDGVDQWKPYAAHLDPLKRALGALWESYPAIS